MPVCGSIVWEFAHGSKDLRDSNRPKVLAKGGEGPHWHVWGGKFALERLPLPSSTFLFFPRSKRDVLNGFYGLSGHGVHVGIVDGGSRGVEMPAAAEEGSHGAYVIAAGRAEAQLAAVAGVLPDEHGEILNNDFFGGTLRGVLSKLDYFESLHYDFISRCDGDEWPE